MNERSSPPAGPSPAPPAPRKPPAVVGRDREFLPAALEILELPPPPLPIALMATISLFAARGARLVLLRPARRARGRRRKGRDGGLFQGDRAARSRQGGGDPRRDGHGRQGRRSHVRTLPAEANADASAAEPPALDASPAEIARRRFAIEAVRRRGSGGREARGRRTRPRPGSGARRGRLRGAAGDRDKPREALAGAAGFSRRLGPGACPSRSGCARRRCCAPTSTQLSDALKALDQQMAQKLATRKRLDMSIAFQNTLMDTLNAARRDAPAGDRPQRRHQDQPLRRQGGAGEVAVAARLRPGPADRDRRGAEGAQERADEDASRSSSPTTRTSSPTPRARRTKPGSRSPRRRLAFSTRSSMRRSTASCSRPR